MVVQALVLAPITAAAEPNAISNGSLTWGVKSTWRSYAGVGEMSGGATRVASGEYSFPLSGGTYDPATGTTSLRFSGGVHWQSHYYPNEASSYDPPSGYAGPLDIYVLDLTLSDPEILIGPDGGGLTVHAVGRNVNTWEMTDFGRVPFATLDILHADTSFAADSSTWSGIPSSLTAEAAQGPMGGFYQARQSIDPVSFAYDGPGGLPDFSETWTPAGTALAEITAQQVVSTNPQWKVLWADQDAGLVHTSESDSATGETRLRAFDLSTMQFVGEPYAIPPGSRAASIDFVAPELGRAYFRSTASTLVDSYLSWDSGTRSYAVHSIPGGGTSFVQAGWTLWDSQRHVGYNLRKVIPSGVGSTAYDSHRWELYRYALQADGTFVATTIVLPNGPTGWNRFWYQQSTGTPGSWALASDGSIVYPRYASTSAGNTAPGAVTSLPALQIAIDGDTATVREIPGSDIGHLSQTPSSFFQVALTTPSGTLALIRPATASQTAQVRFYDLVDGTFAPVSDVIDLGDTRATAFAIDDEDGTVWAQEATTQRLAAVRSSGVAAELSSSFLHPKKAQIVAVRDRAAYVLSSDGEAYEIGKNLFGFARVEITATSPTIADQPDGVTVENTESLARFEARAIGSPSPSVQWQQKGPGDLRFGDVAGATGDELEVDPSSAVTGTEFRAVFTNIAGRIATEAAVLTILAAPTISSHPLTKAVRPGGDATFQVLASGNPEPSIEWQQHVDDEWVAVAGPAFETDGGNLTVRGAQTSAQFRAKVSNSQGTVYSTVASLTVELPQGGEDGSITGLPNSIGARTTVAPAVELSAGETVRVSGSGFLRGSNEAGAYVLFGYVAKFPSADGALGAGYDYIPGQDKQRFVAWPESETAGSANGAFAADGSFAVDGLAVASSFTGASGAAVNCLDNSVQCGVITIGAHGGRDANLETFTPVYFEGQSPDVAKRAPVISSSPVSASVTEGQDAVFSAGATGWPIPAVQWQSRLADAGGWVDIPGATAASYRVAEATLGASGTRYRAVFTNSEGSATTEAATLTVTRALAPTATQAGSLTWGVKASFRSYIVGPTAKGAISLSGGASSSGGAFRFGQSSAGWDAATGTGSAGYGGAVRFTGHAGVLDVTLSDPGITVTSASSATLSVTANGTRIAIGNVNLAAAAKSAVTGGVGYANAPVTLTAAGVNVFSYGSSQFYGVGTAMDPVSFVIGANATGGGGSTRVAAFAASEWTPPADPPATTGIEGDPAELSEVHAGQELTVWADGFQPGEPGIKVVVYSEPIVLETDLTADASGRATWTGILPAELEPGEHTLTFQGSVNRGIVLDVKQAVAFEGCTVEDATLDWGFKESFRAYIDGSIANGEWTVSDGASYETPLFGWSDGTGVYDIDTARGQVDFTGAIRFTGHDGLLDTTVANPRLQFVDADTAYLLLDVAGVTMEDALAGDTEPVVVTAVPFVKLDLGGGAVELSADGTTLTGTEVPTAITAQGYAAFPNYEAGTAFDPVSFTVTVGSDCTTAIPATTDEEPTTDAVASLGPDLAWLWWALAAVLLAAVVATVVVLLVRRRRAG
ncbi:MAG: HtaA domain-containing protein [Protaetiibacter sp.]